MKFSTIVGFAVRSLVFLLLLFRLSFPLFFLFPLGIARRGGGGRGSPPPSLVKGPHGRGEKRGGGGSFVRKH